MREMASRFDVPIRSIRKVFNQDVRHNPDTYLRAYRRLPESRRPQDSIERESNKARPSPARSRSGALLQLAPPLARTDAVVDLALAVGSNLPGRAVITDSIGLFAPDREGEYGGLALRCAIMSDRRQSTLTAAAETKRELAVLARVVDGAKILAAQLQPDCSARAHQLLDREFDKMCDLEDIGGSEEDDKRRIRQQISFVSTAQMLLVLNPEIDSALWDMLGAMQAPSFTDGSVSVALQALADTLARSLETLRGVLDAEPSALARFVDRSQAEIADLLGGSFDWLLQFRDLHVPSTPRELDFEILPPEPTWEALVRTIRTTRGAGHYELDERRLAVLTALEKHFGPRRCAWYRGHRKADGINADYLVLAITIRPGVEHHAVAASPLAGEHATYVVRAQQSDADWQAILARTKPEARHGGARRFAFIDGRDGVDQYDYMRERVLNYLNEGRNRGDAATANVGLV